MVCCSWPHSISVSCAGISEARAARDGNADARRDDRPARFARAATDGIHPRAAHTLVIPSAETARGLTGKRKKCGVNGSGTGAGKKLQAQRRKLKGRTNEKAPREALSKPRSQASFLPLLHRMEERAGERRRVLLEYSLRLNPLPAGFSRGEAGAAQGFERTSRGPWINFGIVLEISSRRPARSVCIRSGGQTTRFQPERLANQMHNRFGLKARNGIARPEGPGTRRWQMYEAQ